jgi:hypothetical protein
MQLCVQGQLSAGQKQTEEPLIGAGWKTFEICAGPYGWKEDRSIGRHNPQALPAFNETQTIGRLYDKGVQTLQGVPRKAITRLGKSSVSDAATKIAIVTQAAKESVEHDLL